MGNIISIKDMDKYKVSSICKSMATDDLATNFSDATFDYYIDSENDKEYLLVSSIENFRNIDIDKLFSDWFNLNKPTIGFICNVSYQKAQVYDNFVDFKNYLLSEDCALDYLRYFLYRFKATKSTTAEDILKNCLSIVGSNITYSVNSFKVDNSIVSRFGDVKSKEGTRVSFTIMVNEISIPVVFDTCSI